MVRDRRVDQTGHQRDHSAGRGGAQRSTMASARASRSLIRSASPHTPDPVLRSPPSPPARAPNPDRLEPSNSLSASRTRAASSNSGGAPASELRGREHDGSSASNSRSRASALASPCASGRCTQPPRTTRRTASKSARVWLGSSRRLGSLCLLHLPPGVPATQRRLCDDPSPVSRRRLQAVVFTAQQRVRVVHVRLKSR